MKISDKAKGYIEENGAVVTIDFRGCGCCVPIYVPEAELKKPDNPESYKEFYLDGILIYYPNGVVIDDQAFGIDLNSAGSHPCLEVVGINIQSQ
jgi:hypothetical protein